MRAKDGHIALVYMVKDWPALRDMIGDARLHEPRFATQRARAGNMAALDAVMAPWFEARTRAEDECARLEEQIARMDALARQPQSAAMQDKISERRKTARSRQFHLRCR